MAGQRISDRRQRFAAEYVLPTVLASRVSYRMDVADVGPALRGLRQWLRLRILTDEPMGMPSRAVETALKEFLAIGAAADAFRHGVFGRHHHDPLADRVLPDEAAGSTMALTWAMACNDQQLRVNAPPSMPTLFTVDAAMHPAGGWPWTLYCGHDPCAAADRCVHHDVLPYLPAQIPHQVHIGLPRPFPLVDNSDALFGPSL